jgi:hypothetical protein
MEKYRIKISNDEGAENPFIAWDCEPALMYQYGRGYVTDCNDGEIVEFIKQFPSNNQIIKHQKALCDILEIDHDYLCERELTKDEKADEIRWEISTSCNIKQLAQLCELFKIQHLNYTTSSGYSQGDWANVLLVLTDKFYERTGCDRRKAKEILEGSQKLFDAWAWGDVYHFNIEKATEMVKLTRKDFDDGKFENVEDELEWDHHDSYSGFYGEDVDGVAENSDISKEIVKEAFENIDKWVYFNK